MDRFVDVGHSLTNIAGHHFESGQKIGAYADKPHMRVWGEKGTSIEMRARLMPSLQRFGGKHMSTFSSTREIYFTSLSFN